MRKRAYCLYRVSTKAQVEKDDIPMQRQCCREFAQEKGWQIVREFTEKGVSGFKVSAKDRDAIREMQQDAALSKFDILLVFMFDRLGRREDETPFVVEWFVNNGIEVWSTVEGEQRFDNHVDKLMNYIRYWQASGESIKTSIRTKTRLGQLVQEGKFRGGVAPYGYVLVKRGRIGKKNRELYDIEVNKEEAIVVRKMFDLNANYGYGGRRIATELKEKGILNRNGEPFHYSSIQNILRNIMYLGILRSGETRSEIFPELQIIDEEVFDRVSNLRQQRALDYEGQRSLPRRTMGQALLSGNLFCGHCGGRIFATTANKTQRLPEGGEQSVKIPIYKCYNRTQHKEVCNGPTTYRALKVDGVIRDMLLSIFDKVGSVRQDELVNRQFEETVKEYKIQLKGMHTELQQKNKELAKLDALMLDTLDNKSAFTPERLGRQMDAVEARIKALEDGIQNTEAKLQKSSELIAQIRAEYSQLISWAEVFADANIDVQKMIATSLIKSVTISRDYHLDVDLNITQAEYTEGLEL